MKSQAMRLVRALPPTSDVEALRRVAQGDVAALGEVYDRHARALLRFVARAHDPNEAEDVVQAVFVRASRAAATYDGRTESARAWLFGIAARLMQERRRALVRMSRALLRLAGRTASPPVPEPQHLDLEKGLRRLSDAKRVVLILADVEGFACGEIAEVLGIPIGTVWTRLHHARKELRQYCEEGDS